jgi:hypothetical protein
VVSACFYAPYNRWRFGLALPEDPPEPSLAPEDSYAGYKRPPRKIGPLKLEPIGLSDIINSAMLNSLLWVVFIFGAMASVAAIAQLFYGGFYVGHDEALEIVDYADEPLRYLRVLFVYAVICLGTVCLGLVLRYWKQLRLELPKVHLNLGKKPGGNLR